MLTYGDPITIYSCWKHGKDLKWVRTNIELASWYGKQAVNMGASDLRTADLYSVRIMDWETGAYVPPDIWNELEELPDLIWTVQVGDVVVKGTITDEITGITEITGKYNDCFVVTAAYDNRRIALKHIHIEGK